MILTKEFLGVLQQRLKVGNRRGVHLNAIPGRSRFKFDLNNLRNIRDSFPEDFLSELLSKSKFNFKIDFKGVDLNLLNDTEKKRIVDISKKLNNLEREIKDIELEKGINTFGFGYPLLIRRDQKDNKITVSPLFIWTLKITRPKEINTWRIIKSEDDPIILNEVLINHLEADSGIKINPIGDEYLEDNLIDNEELVELCLSALRQTNNNVTEKHIDVFEEKCGTVSRIPQKSKLEEIVNHNSYIHWGGLFSVFQTQKESIIKEFDHLLSLEGSQFELGETDNHDFQTISSIQTDPSQQGILTALKSKRNLVVHGPPGTGKSQTLTAIITNALENGKRVLVVCEKRTALDVIYDNLREKGLEELAVVIKDTKKDRRVVVDAVRAKTDGHQYSGENERRYFSNLSTGINSCKNFINKVNNCHKFLGQNLLEGRKWTDIVGMFLEKETLLEGEIPDLGMDVPYFKYTFREYVEINNTLTKAESIYNEIYTYLDRFILNPEKLKGDNRFIIEDNLKATLVGYQKELEKIKEYEAKYKKASRQLVLDKLRRDSSTISNSVLKIRQKFEKNYLIPEFLDTKKTSSFLFSVIAFFSKKKKAIIESQQYCFEEYKNLFDFAKNVFSSEFKPKLVSDLPLMAQELDKLEKGLIWFKENENNFIDKELEFEKEGKSVFDFKMLKEFKALNIFKANLFNEIHEAKIFHKKLDLFRNDGSVISYVGKAINLALNHLKDEQFGLLLDWFDLFNEDNSIVAHLIESLKNKKHWSNQFSLFYLNSLLKKNGVGQHHIPEIEYQNLSQEIEGIDKSQAQYILAHWGNKQRKAVSEFNTRQELNVKNLYNKRSSSNYKRHSLRMIISEDFDLFSSFYPVVLTTPVMACTMFGGSSEKEPFDIVLFDEASQLRVEENLPAMLKGKQKIVAGDEHQMPPSNYFATVFDGEVEDDDIEEDEVEKVQLANALLSTNSLLEFSIDMNFDNRYLDFHYRSRHPYLIDYSNAAFYNGRLCPMPSKYDYCPISFLQIDGTYISGTNEREAEKVIEILIKGIKKDEQGKYPSVGVATFNVKQRNLILEKIRERCTGIGSEKIATKISELEGNGLFVKNLENIQGDERDIIILSTTYGRDPNGGFAQRFGPINQAKGYKLLNVIVTRAKYKVYVCTSIPDSVYGNYKEELVVAGSNNRRAAFYAYLAYAKAVSEQNEEMREAVLTALTDNSDLVKDEHLNAGLGCTESPFEEEVYQKMLSRFPKDEILLQYKYAGFRIDMVYKSKDENMPLIAIECDGAKYHSSTEAYLHDIYRQKILEDNGFVFYRIWSTKWWRNSKREFEKMINFINKIQTDVSRNNDRLKTPLPHLADEVDAKLTAQDNGGQTTIPFNVNNNLVPSNARPVAINPTNGKVRIQIGSKILLKRVSSETELRIKVTDNKSGSYSQVDGVFLLGENTELVKSVIGRTEGELVNVSLPGETSQLLYRIIELG